MQQSNAKKQKLTARDIHNSLLKNPGLVRITADFCHKRTFNPKTGGQNHIPTSVGNIVTIIGSHPRGTQSVTLSVEEFALGLYPRFWGEKNGVTTPTNLHPNGKPILLTAADYYAGYDLAIEMGVRIVAEKIFENLKE